MTTSQKTAFLSEINSGKPIPPNKLAYFQARLRNRLYDFIVTKFADKEKNEGLTKAELARRIGRKPEVVTRLLGAPGNWTIDTISDLLLGISGEELEPASSSLKNDRPRNFVGPEWLKPNGVQTSSREPSKTISNGSVTFTERFGIDTHMSPEEMTITKDISVSVEVL
jgi:hypothetical protein